MLNEIQKKMLPYNVTSIYRNENKNRVKLYRGITVTKNIVQPIEKKSLQRAFVAVIKSFYLYGC